MAKTKEPTFVTERIEVLVRPIWPESDGRFCVLLRDGHSVVMTYEGTNDGAVQHAETLHSILAAMHTRVSGKK